MKVIIAPSKTMKYIKNEIKGKDILYKEENEYLHHILKQYNDEDIMNLMKISYKQAIKVIEYYKRWPDTKLIQRAYNYAVEKHGEQKSRTP